jgi:hypothetical protein
MMRIAPATAQRATIQSHSARGEFFVRYTAAYGCTLVAIAAAQLIIPSTWAAAMALITLVGLPLSLSLRKSKLHLFGWRIPRFLINSMIVILSCFASAYVLIVSQPELFTRGFYNTIMIARSAGDSITLLMNLFLVFAVFRSLAIITDKDAVLSAVPSFSILLLLIVVHRGPQVVAYFLLWAIAAAVLFALDHRAEMRHRLSGVVPSLVPGQDMKLAARGLATVLGFSLACAIGISSYLSSRNPEERGQMENWILGMAGRMTQLALNLPDVSINSGPERQIDYSSGPALPTRTELWTVAAASDQLQPLRPQYWRMFTLSLYNGSTWSQSPGSGTAIPLERLHPGRMPRFRQSSQSVPASGMTFQTNSGRSTENRSAKRSERRSTSNGRSAPSNDNQRTQTSRNSPRNNDNGNGSRVVRRRRGYDIAGHYPYAAQMMQNFGGERRVVAQFLEPRVSNIGFIPALPTARIVRIRAEEPPSALRVRHDGAIDAGVLQVGQPCLVISEVAPVSAYGRHASDNTGPPLSRSQSPNPHAKLSRAERLANLQLPPYFQRADSRMRRFVQQVLHGVPTRDSDYMRAKRLSLAVQSGAVYTLRPPQIPQGRDAAEYFLFESRRGYCTYFAGALTVACRVAGIPARVVSGFVNPDWGVTADQVGILREANAHAWTEVWVDGWGWAPLDATPADNRGHNAPDWWDNWKFFFASTADSVKHWVAAHRGATLTLTLALMAALLWAVARSGLTDAWAARLALATRGRLAVGSDRTHRLIARAYARAMKKLAGRFRRAATWETPREYLAAAETALHLEDPQPLRELTQLYERLQYAPNALQISDGTRAVELLRALSLRSRRVRPDTP